MTRGDAETTVTPIGDRLVETGPLPDDALAISHSYCEASQANRGAWHAIIVRKLIEWGRHPDRLEDDELIPPTRKAIAVACELASSMRDQGWAPPKRVVPDGDGGIVLEHWDGLDSVNYEVAGDGGIEFVRLREHRVVDRMKIL